MSSRSVRSNVLSFGGTDSSCSSQKPSVLELLPTQTCNSSKVTALNLLHVELAHGFLHGRALLHVPKLPQKQKHGPLIRHPTDLLFQSRKKVHPCLRTIWPGALAGRGQRPLLGLLLGHVGDAAALQRAEVVLVQPPELRLVVGLLLQHAQLAQKSRAGPVPRHAPRFPLLRRRCPRLGGVRLVQQRLPAAGLCVREGNRAQARPPRLRHDGLPRRYRQRVVRAALLRPLLRSVRRTRRTRRILRVPALGRAELRGRLVLKGQRRAGSVGAFCALLRDDGHRLLHLGEALRRGVLIGGGGGGGGLVPCVARAVVVVLPDHRGDLGEHGLVGGVFGRAVHHVHRAVDASQLEARDDLQLQMRVVQGGPGDQGLAGLRDHRVVQVQLLQRLAVLDAHGHRASALGVQHVPAERQRLQPGVGHHHMHDGGDADLPQAVEADLQVAQADGGHAVCQALGAVVPQAVVVQEELLQRGVAPQRVHQRRGAPGRDAVEAQLQHLHVPLHLQGLRQAGQAVVPDVIVAEVQRFQPRIARQRCGQVTGARGADATAADVQALQRLVAHDALGQGRRAGRAQVVAGEVQAHQRAVDLEGLRERPRAWEADAVAGEVQRGEAGVAGQCGRQRLRARVADVVEAQVQAVQTEMRRHRARHRGGAAVLQAVVAQFQAVQRHRALERGGQALGHRLAQAAPAQVHIARQRRGAAAVRGEAEGFERLAELRLAHVARLWRAAAAACYLEAPEAPARRERPSAPARMRHETRETSGAPGGKPHAARSLEAATGARAYYARTAMVEADVGGDYNLQQTELLKPPCGSVSPFKAGARDRRDNGRLVALKWERREVELLLRQNTNGRCTQCFDFRSCRHPIHAGPMPEERLSPLASIGPLAAELLTALAVSCRNCIRGRLVSFRSPVLNLVSVGGFWFWPHTQ
eukprot:scaffold578_cov243-Pinguiococcus_pyrenoidosus.AAC.17